MKKLQTRDYLTRLCDIRWRFDYPDRCVVPDWNDHREGHAESVDKTDLVSASIEIKDKKTGEVRIIAMCPRWEFKGFKWIATVGHPFNGFGKQGVQITPSIQGIELYTIDKIVRFYIDGRMSISTRSKGV